MQTSIHFHSAAVGTDLAPEQQDGIGRDSFDRARARAGSTDESNEGVIFACFAACCAPLMVVSKSMEGLSLRQDPAFANGCPLALARRSVVADLPIVAASGCALSVWDISAFPEAAADIQVKSSKQWLQFCWSSKFRERVLESKSEFEPNAQHCTIKDRHNITSSDTRGMVNSDLQVVHSWRAHYRFLYWKGNSFHTFID